MGRHEGTILKWSRGDCQKVSVVKAQGKSSNKGGVWRGATRWKRSFVQVEIWVAFVYHRKDAWVMVQQGVIGPAVPK